MQAETEAKLKEHVLKRQADDEAEAEAEAAANKRAAHARSLRAAAKAQEQAVPGTQADGGDKMEDDL